MPDPDSTRICRVGENGTRNRPGMLVGSVGSGCVRLRVVPIGFGFHCQCSHFGWIRWDLARSRRELTGSQRDLARSRRIWTRSRQDLTVSHPIWWVSSKFSPENAVFVCFRWRTPNIARSFWLYARVGLLGFWERKPANRPTDVGFCGQRPTTDRRSGQFGRFRFGLGRVAWVSRVPGWVWQS